MFHKSAPSCGVEFRPPILYMIFWGQTHTNPHPKRHLDWFTAFAGLTVLTGTDTRRHRAIALYRVVRIKN